jgi:hypothetical protein
VPDLRHVRAAGGMVERSPLGGMSGHLTRRAQGQVRHDAQMSRRRTVSRIEALDTSVETSVQRVLDELCVVLGFCLGPAENARLCAEPPTSVDAFVEAVIRSEGMDPVYLDGNLLEQMRQIVLAGAGRIL